MSILNTVLTLTLILSVCLSQYDKSSHFCNLKGTLPQKIMCPQGQTAFLLTTTTNQTKLNYISVYYWLYHSSKIRCGKRVLQTSIKNHHLLLKILLSGQIELNPGPRTPRWPCGSCGKNVNWKNKALECDSCKTWYHVDCQGGMPTFMYNIMDNSNLSWNCIKCGLPNISSSFFNQTELSTSKSFTMLSDISQVSSPGKPNASSSPIPKKNNLKGNHTNVKSQNKLLRPLKIINVNFQSIKNKKPELDILINSTQPDVIIGTETWLDPKTSAYEYISKDLYTIYRKDRAPNKKGLCYGGVLIAISNKYLSSEIKELQTDCEIVWAELSISNARKCYICAYYRPHPDDDISLDPLNASISRINANSKSIIIVGGDFNLGHMNWETHSVIPGKPNQKQHQQLLDIINDHGLKQVVNEPTRNDKTLDLIMTNYPSIVDKIETIPPLGEADHDIVSLECVLSLKRCQTTPRKIFKYKQANWTKIQQDIDKIHQEIIEKKKTTDINGLWQIFKNSLHQSISENIPQKMLRHNKNLPWITTSLKRQMKRYNKKYRKCKLKGQQKPESLKKLKHEIQKQKREAYWKYIENMICNIPIDDANSFRSKLIPKNLFSYIKTQKSESSNIPPLSKDGILTSDPKSKANILNQQFQNAFTPVTEDPIPDKGHQKYPQMPDINITNTGVTKLLKNINIHKAAGPDQIHGRILKECSSSITPILQILFQTSLDTGKIPDDWRHASVCPAFKKGDKHDPINYRPISLTCICCKLLEHVITSNIMKHLEDNHILYDFQHGFRSSRSCETQLTSFIQDLSKASNNNIQTDIIIMDFAKAFDKVSHRHLLYKISYYGINCNALNWVKDFLTNRTQNVVLEGETSNNIPVTSGVPQGTVLGPILFLIYINNLAEYMKHSKLRLFADDSIIYKEIKTPDDCKKLQEDLDSAGRWEQEWLMHFHPDKCNILSVTQKQKPIETTYKLHGHSLEKVDSTKYLGVTLQSNLKWDKHINNMTAKANQSLGFLRRNLKISSEKVKSHAYKALVRPKLEYCSTIWDPYQKQQITQIEKVQRRAARFTCNRFHNTSSVSDMFTHLNWYPLQVRRLKYRLVFFHKIIHQIVAVPASNLLILADSRTRHSNPFSYKHIQTSKDCYKYSFFPHTITQWNKLPIQATSVNTVEGFKALVTEPALIPIFFP